MDAESILPENQVLLTVGIGLVLSAVFGPMIFFPGSTGVIYRQFSVTVIASMLLSVVVALILTPVLCAGLLKPVEKGHEAAETGFRLLRPFFLWFDRWFYRIRDWYEVTVSAPTTVRIRTFDRTGQACAPTNGSVDTYVEVKDVKATIAQAKKYLEAAWTPQIDTEPLVIGYFDQYYPSLSLMLAAKPDTAFGIGTLVHAWLAQIDWLDDGLPCQPVTALYRKCFGWDRCRSSNASIN